MGNPNTRKFMPSKKLLSSYYKKVFEKLFSNGWVIFLSRKILSEKNLMALLIRNDQKC